MKLDQYLVHEIANVLKTTHVKKNIISSNKIFMRINKAEFLDPFGSAVKAEYRFDDPEQKFSVIYLAEAFKTAFIETVIRDSVAMPRPIPLTRRYDIDPRNVIRLNLNHIANLEILDLTNNPTGRLGMPRAVFDSNAKGGANENYKMSQHWAHALYHQYANIDGFKYRSSFQVGNCYVIFDRAIHKLRRASLIVEPLAQARELRATLREIGARIDPPVSAIS